MSLKLASTNISWTDLRVTDEMRAARLGQRGVVVWLTGLSGSGKSTMAVGLDSRLHSQGIASYILDGDNLRHGLCRDLGFSDEDRRENIRRTGEVAKLMAQSGIVVICSLISPFRVDRVSVRGSCEKDTVLFTEIYVSAPLATCELRDPKGLYKKARAGEIQGFTGIDSPYEPPEEPGLSLDTAETSIEACQERLFNHVLNLSRLQ
jgi:adenylyl-sulfate kinase